MKMNSNKHVWLQVQKLLKRALCNLNKMKLQNRNKCKSVPKFDLELDVHYKVFKTFFLYYTQFKFIVNSNYFLRHFMSLSLLRI